MHMLTSDLESSCNNNSEVFKSGKNPDHGLPTVIFTGTRM